jgi:hypothetical protein
VRRLQFLALFGHAVATGRCPFLGVKLTSGSYPPTSGFYPERTSMGNGRANLIEARGQFELTPNIRVERGSLIERGSAGDLQDTALL